VAEKRKALQSILLNNGRKTPLKIELFCATQWPGASGARVGLLRIRVNRKWLCPSGKYTFFNAQGVAALLTALVAGVDPLEICEPPDLPRSSPVRVPTGTVLSGQPLYDKTRTNTEPLLGIDGRWHVSVTLVGRGTFHTPVDELEMTR